MSLSPQFLDEVRERTPMSALVGRSVRLKKAGNEWQACCPFHNEKTPSFYVNDDKAFAHCFGCGWNGDAIKWVQDKDGLEFIEAVRQLAEAAGMEMPARDPVQQRREDRNADLHQITGLAEQWFATQLAGLAGADARAYLAKRGITDDTARAFGLGFAPDNRSAIRKGLAELGDRALIELGLLVAPEDGREPYDRFRGRLIFPIHDARGRAISFGGRILGQGEPKYLNGPDSALFDKGRTLFNLHRAGPAGRKAGRLIIVEGYIDVIALAQIGIEEAVAPLGTALTEAQIERLWRITPIPILCFDGDQAGQRASVKAALRALPNLQPGQSLAFAALPTGQDPDDLARAGGREALDRLLAAAMPLVDLLWRHEYRAQPLDTPEARAALRQRLVAHARSIGDRDVGREYEGEYRRRVDAIFEQAKGRRGKPPPQLGTATPGVDPALAVGRKMMAAVLRGLARHPSVAMRQVETIAALEPADHVQAEAIDLIINGALGGEPPSVELIDDLFPGERGWQGFRFSYHDPKTRPELAEADLDHALDMLLAAKEGVPADDLIRMRESYRPPIAPEPGKLV